MWSCQSTISQSRSKPRTETALTELARTTADEELGDLVVVEGDEPVGIAALDDVVATAGEMLDDVATVIEAQSREYEPDD